MTVEISSGAGGDTGFLLQQQQQRDERFQQMAQMNAGEQQPTAAAFTGVPGGPPTGRHISEARRPNSSHAILARKQLEQRQAMAEAPAVVHELRKRMDDKNTDRYYRSSEVSAIGAQSPDGTTMAPGQTRPAPNTFRSGVLRQLDERNTDRYYRDALERGMTKQQIEQHNARVQAAQRGQLRPQIQAALSASPALTPQGSSTKPVQHAQAVHPLVIDTTEAIRPAVEHAAQMILNGA